MSDELVTIARFSEPFEAELSRNDLQAAGIKAFLIGQSFTSNVWHLTTAVGGIRLQVAAGDAQRAAQILSDIEHAHHEPSSANTTSDELENADNETATGRIADYLDEEEPLCETDELTPREKDAKRALFSAVLGLLLPPLAIYTVWLLIKVAFSEERLSRQMRNRAIWAVVLSLPTLVFLSLFFKQW